MKITINKENLIKANKYKSFSRKIIYYQPKITFLNSLTVFLVLSHGFMHR